ncbi:hypothetical protein SOVF_096390, partial [Spinacia oleracea]
LVSLLVCASVLLATGVCRVLLWGEACWLADVVYAGCRSVVQLLVSARFRLGASSLHRMGAAAYVVTLLCTELCMT